MERAAGGIFALLVIAVIGLGAYAWLQHQGMLAAQSQVAGAEARAKTAEASALDSSKRLTASGTALNGCQTQLADANKRAEAAAAARPPARRR